MEGCVLDAMKEVPLSDHALARTDRGAYERLRRRHGLEDAGHSQRMRAVFETLPRELQKVLGRPPIFFNGGSNTPLARTPAHMPA